MKNINESKNPTPKNNSKFTLVVSIGVTKAMVDKTNKILKIFDPIIFPKDIPISLLESAINVTNNSGKDVPMATTVIPIAFSEKPNCSTKGIAPLSTNNTDPKYNMVDPAIILNTDLCTGQIFSFSSSPLHDVILGLKKLAMI